MTEESSDGVFVVLEGIDGSGTTTQAAVSGASPVARAPRSRTREPSVGPLDPN